VELTRNNIIDGAASREVCLTSASGSEDELRLYHYSIAFETRIRMVVLLLWWYSPFETWIWKFGLAFGFRASKSDCRGRFSWVNCQKIHIMPSNQHQSIELALSFLKRHSSPSYDNCKPRYRGDWVESLLSMYCNPSRVETIHKASISCLDTTTNRWSATRDSKTPLVVLIGQPWEKLRWMSCAGTVAFNSIMYEWSMRRQLQSFCYYLHCSTPSSPLHN